MNSYSEDQEIKFQHTPVTNKIAFNLNHVGAHAGDAIEVTSLTHTDANTIYVNGSTGSDSNAGTAAAPKLTILASINATTSSKIYVLVMNSQHFAEDLSTATTTYLTGLFANTAITATLSTRVTPTFADADTIFFGGTSGTSGGDGTLADPYDTIANAIAATDATHQRICEIDGDTYTEPGIEMTGNFLGMYALEGKKPTFQPTATHDISDFTDDTAIKALTTFSANVVRWIKCDSFSNGKFVIAFDDFTSGTGKFIIYNADGSVSVAETVFEDSGDPVALDIAVLDNDEFVISYKDSGNLGKFVIYTIAGAVSVAETTFESNTIGNSTTCVKLNNGDFVIAYTDTTDNDSNFIIYTESGSVSKAKTQFSANNALDVSGDVLQTDNFVLAYTDDDDGDKGKFLILSEDGASTIKAITEFDANDIDDIKVATLNNGNFVIVYTDTTDGDSNYIIFDADGNAVIGKTQMVASARYSYGISSLENGDFVTTAGGIGAANSLYRVSENDLTTIIADQTLGDGDFYSDCTTLSNGNCVMISSDDTNAIGSFMIRCFYSWPGLKISAASTVNGFILDGQDSYQLTKLIEANSAIPTIKWCDIKNTTNPSTSVLPGYGIYGDNETDLYNSKIYDNDGGLYLTANVDDCIIHDCQFFRNDGTYAIRIDGEAASSGDITIEHTDVFNNYAGIRLENNNGTNEILKNNIIHNNDNYGVEADESVTLSYTVRTDTNLLASDGTSVLLANPLYINEGAVSEEAIDLNIKTTVEGYPSDSPGKDLADDTRNAGSHDVRYIGSATTWTSITVPKDRRSAIKIFYEPVSGTKSIGQDGTVEYSKKGQTENVEIQWSGLLNADYIKVRKMWMSNESEVRVYWQPTTSPATYTTYTMTRKSFNAGVAHYELSRTGVSDFSIQLSRKYEEPA